MSVTIRPYRKGGWEVDITFRLPNGRRYRERCKAPVNSKSGALRWAQDRERHLLLNGPEEPKKEAPTLEQFASRFIEGYAVANRQKPSGIAAKRTILNVHLVPAFGTKRLDEITNEDIQRLKHSLKERSPKTVNNVLTVLSVLLKKAVEWEALTRLSCTVRLVRAPKPTMGFYDFADYGRLIEAAKTLNPATQLVVLLAGEAGLRCGEIIGLEWRDVNFENRQLCVERSEWRGHVTVPKGGRNRHVPMTQRLTKALAECGDNEAGHRVLRRNDGSPLGQEMVGDHVRRAASRAGVSVSGAHRLRHTFCSHLAMRGAPARAIQELAGHQNLGTTERYMHLSPSALEGAIRLLEPQVPSARGDILETPKQ
jgi:integrase